MGSRAKLSLPTIFIIGVKKRYRGLPLERHLRNLELNFENYWGLDGSTISNHSEDLLAFQLVPEILTGFRMSLGEICCALAHLEIYELMIDRNLPWVCILEDDAVPLGDLREVFNSFATFTKASILGLNEPLSKSDINPKLSKREIVSHFADEHSLFIKLVHPRLQTYAYLINLEAAKLIVKRKKRKNKVSARADWPLEIYPGIDFFVCDEPRFTHDDNRSDSIISKDRYREKYESTGILGSILRSKFARISGLTYLVLAIIYVNFKSMFSFILVKKFCGNKNLGEFVQKLSIFYRR